QTETRKGGGRTAYGCIPPAAHLRQASRLSFAAHRTTAAGKAVLPGRQAVFVRRAPQTYAATLCRNCPHSDSALLSLKVRPLSCPPPGGQRPVYPLRGPVPAVYPKTRTYRRVAGAR